jgi:predicted methyltransferase
MVGKVLDTATGLGYTAIQAAHTAEHVTTIELDPAVLQVCRLNPWSQDLFENPKITQVIGDSFDVVAEMEAGSFTRVIHDPPAFSLAGDLYSGEFYRELNRVMRNRSLLFHYVGDPESKSGRSITAGVMRRLEQAGFRQVRRAPRAFGVLAVK